MLASVESSRQKLFSSINQIANFLRSSQADLNGSVGGSEGRPDSSATLLTRNSRTRSLEQGKNSRSRRNGMEAGPRKAGC